MGCRSCSTGSTPLHLRDAVAGVQLRARPPAGVGAPRALCALAERTELLAGIDEQVFIDIDSLLRPVYGHAKQGASYGHTKIAGKQVLRKGLSPLATTISTEHSAPVIAGCGSARARPARARAPGGWSPRRSPPPAPPVSGKARKHFASAIWKFLSAFALVTAVAESFLTSQVP